MEALWLCRINFLNERHWLNSDSGPPFQGRHEWDWQAYWWATLALSYVWERAWGLFTAPYRFPFTVELKLTGPENIGHVSWPEEEFNITRDPLSPEEETTLLRMKTIVFQMRCLAWIVLDRGLGFSGAANQGRCYTTYAIWWCTYEYSVVAAG